MYRIFLSDKLKRKNVRNLFKIIDLFQSYDADWQTYFIDIDVNINNAERVTPIPTNYGALLFREFYISEERLLRIVRKKFSSKEYIEKIFRKSGLIGRRFWKMIYRYPEILDSASIEIFVPLEEAINTEYISIDLHLADTSLELINSPYSYVDPRIVESVLDEAYFLGEYLDKLFEKYMAENIVIENGYILLIKGIIDMNTTLTQLEANIDEFLKNIDGCRNISMMFNRIF